MSKVLAIDIGATKAALAVVDHDLKLVEKTSIPTGNNLDIWQKIAVETEKLVSKFNSEIVSIGIASAGPIDLTEGSISPVNIPEWRNFPIMRKFSELLNLNVTLQGDAIALAHAEAKVGAGIGISNFLGMVVSTGIGGGLIINGETFNGETGNAGYFGHNVIQFSNESCSCGRNGCVEQFASGPKMVEYAVDSGWQNPAKDFKSLAADAILGNEIAIKSIERGTKALAIGIVNVLALLDINTVIIGGGVVQSGPIYWDKLVYEVEFEAKTIGFLGQVDLRQSKLGPDAGLIGAALAALK